MRQDYSGNRSQYYGQRRQPQENRPKSTRTTRGTHDTADGRTTQSTRRTAQGARRTTDSRTAQDSRRTTDSGTAQDRRRTTDRMSVSHNRRRSRKRHPVRKFIFRLILLFIVLVVAAVVYLISCIDSIENHKLQNVTINDMDDPNIEQYTNIAIFGVDSRANDLRKNTRSDSIMIASIHKKTHEVKLLSVYRDTYVKIEDHGCTKVNHAYAYGGPDLAVNTLNTNFDLNIRDFVTVNFSALSNVIDALGGITLDIQKEELKWVNAYGRDVARINGTKYTKIKTTGKQTVTGAQATGYCRVRYTKGGDFTRAERQRTVLQAIFDKVKHSNPVTLVNVMNEMLPQIYTSLSTQDMLNLVKYLPFYEIGNQEGFPYKQNCYRGSDGIYYDFPDSLLSNVKKLHQSLFGTENYKPSSTVRKISKSTSSR